MRYSDKDIIVISVCLLTLTVAIVMYIALCVYNVLRRRGKLRGMFILYVGFSSPPTSLNLHAEDYSRIFSIKSV